MTKEERDLDESGHPIFTEAERYAAMDRIWKDMMRAAQRRAEEITAAAMADTDDEVWRKAIGGSSHAYGAGGGGGGESSGGTGRAYPRIDDVPAAFTPVSVGFDPGPRPGVYFPKVQSAEEVIDNYRTQIYDLEKAGRLIDAKAVRKELDEYRARLAKEEQK